MIQLFEKLNKSSLWALFCGLWAWVVFVPLIPFPFPGAIVGHPWKVELVFSLILSITLFWLILIKRNFLAHFFVDKSVIFWLMLPLSLLTIWSASSVFWANSKLSAFHHTFVWS